MNKKETKHNTLLNNQIFNLEDFDAALPTELSVETDLLASTPFPSSQETRLKERSSVVRLWKKAREVLDAPKQAHSGAKPN